jgi:hypothetical protein
MPLVPPHMHRRNAAERAIHTWKNHFTAGICSADPTFPLHLFSHMIEQVTITINLLRASRRNPNVSAHNILEGFVLILMQRRWRHQARKSSSTKSHNNVDRGTHMESKDDIWDRPNNTIDDSRGLRNYFGDPVS